MNCLDVGEKWRKKKDEFPHCSAVGLRPFFFPYNAKSINHQSEIQFCYLLLIQCCERKKLRSRRKNKSKT